jgi:predicted nucleic acid-binding Zn ribbon protein
MTSNEKTLGEAIQELLKHYSIDSKLNHVKLIGSWPQKVGTLIARHTRNLYVHNRCLFVELDSSVIRHELSLSKTVLLTRLNEDFDSPVIDDIILK